MSAGAENAVWGEGRRRPKSHTTRPKRRRWALQLCVVVFVVLSVVHLVFAIPYWTGEPKPPRNFVLELNAEALAVPENERAWPVYREAFIALGAPLPRELDLSARPGDEGWEGAARHVREHSGATDLIRRAAGMEHLGYVAIGGIHEEDAVVVHDPERVVSASETTPERMRETWVLDLHHPQLGALRTLARALRVEALLAADADDGDRVVENIRTILRIAKHVKWHDMLIHDLVVISIVDAAVSLTKDVLTDHADSLSHAHLTDLADLFSGIDLDALLEIQLEGESLIFEDFLQRTHSSNGRLGRSGYGFFESLQESEATARTDSWKSMLFGPIAAAFLPRQEASMRHYRGLLHEELRIKHIPMWEWDQHRDWSDTDQFGLKDLRHPFAYILLPALQRTSVNEQVAMQQRDGALVAIALELFRRERGEWPASLDELVPRFLPAVPRDRFDGGPIKYALRNGAPVVYSIGANREDNGGTAPTINGYPTVNAASRWIPMTQVLDQRERLARGEKVLPHMLRAPEGDWILFPPVRPGPFDPYADLREGAQDDQEEGEEG